MPLFLLGLASFMHIAEVFLLEHDVVPLSRVEGRHFYPFLVSLRLHINNYRQNKI